MKPIFALLLCSLICACNPQPEVITPSTKSIQKSSSPIFLDGKASEKVWTTSPWYAIDQVWLGEPFTQEDFSGRYKLSWDEKFLYVYAEIIDDKLIDINADALDRYWDDDCLEIFVDENRSKGIHQYNHNAFAYHIGLSGDVVDLGQDSLPQLYHHVKSRRITTGNKSIWECAIEIHADTYRDNTRGKPVQLKTGKKMGFAIAYCDNDNSKERENFIGSVAVHGEDKNRGWIDAGIFEELTLN